MRKVILWSSVSLDGFIEGPNREIDWHLVDDELHRHVNAELGAMGGFLEGRLTYELMAAVWPTADADPASTPPMVEFARIWLDMPKIVYSRTLQRADWNTTIARAVEPAAIHALKAQPGGDLMVGGADLAASFRRHDLVDEYRLYVHPVVIGAGKSLFGPADARLALRRVETRVFGNGVVLLRYLRPDGAARGRRAGLAVWIAAGRPRRGRRAKVRREAQSALSERRIGPWCAGGVGAPHRVPHPARRLEAEPVEGEVGALPQRAVEGIGLEARIVAGQLRGVRLGRGEVIAPVERWMGQDVDAGLDLHQPERGHPGEAVRKDLYQGRQHARAERRGEGRHGKRGHGCRRDDHPHADGGGPQGGWLEDDAAAIPGLREVPEWVVIGLPPGETVAGGGWSAAVEGGGLAARRGYHRGQ
jgi:dihydrofolate reductase